MRTTMVSDEPVVRERGAATKPEVARARTDPERAGGASTHSHGPQAAAKLMLHVFPSFGAGGVPIRMTGILNRFGTRYRHAIIACDRDTTACDRFDSAVPVTVVEPPPRPAAPWGGLTSAVQAVRRLRPDLLLTYNWGAIEWALACRAVPRLPHIHFESGFGPEEAHGQIRRRVLFRRLALGSTYRVVVPSQSLVRIAREVWRIDEARLLYIANGVDCDRYAAAPDPTLVPGFDKKPGELVIGTVAPLRPEKNLRRLVRVFAGVSSETRVRLLLVGEGKEREALAALARELRVADRVHFAGYVAKPERVLGLFDVFALSSDTEQMPNAVLQAMAAGLPIASTDVGDVRAIVARENHPYVTPLGDDEALGRAFAALLRDAALRASLGRTNSAHVREHFPLARMFQAYSDLFDSALRRGDRHDRSRPTR
jgi:glycosyltransferase involved in cell wall biosynthesis